ncbi:MAG: hypothetical protein ISS58_05825 [Dehalococcoidales bacterium]|nr:hypothetical protein [Dehalococcoidales bacterium]
MDNKEDIKLVLNHYPYINRFLGEIVEQRLLMPNNENGVITSQLIKAKDKLPASEYERSENDDFDDEYFDDEEWESASFKLDSGLHLLNKTLAYGDQFCEGFSYIFQNIKFTKHQEADTRISEVLAQVKAFECLSKLGYKKITKVDQWQNQLNVDFVARKSPDYFAIMVTRLYSAKHVEENFLEYDENSLARSLTTDISYAINQSYPKIEKYCTNHVGVDKGIIIISSSRDFFGNKKLENTLYGLKTTRVISILNREWTTRKEGQNKHKYLNHLVITTGRNVWNAFTYPRMRSINFDHKTL